MDLIVIVGLGNPGSRYEGTRHNVGFKAIDSLADKLGISIDQNKWNSIIGEGRFAGKKIILAKPQTYMNNSGLAVSEILNFYKASEDELIVIHDDIDISLGTIRVKRNGSSGGHNGIKSIIQNIGGGDFSRVKIAVGRRPWKMDLADFVLSKFKDEEQKIINEEIEAARDAALMTVEKGPDYSMNVWNAWHAPSLPEKSPEEIEKDKEENKKRLEQEKFKKQAEMCGD